MDLKQYRTFTATLTETLAVDGRVVGLIALGSMAEQDYPPDRWSDHDFFVITEPGAQEAFRADLSWLPDHQRAGRFRRRGAEQRLRQPLPGASRPQRCNSAHGRCRRPHRQGSAADRRQR